MAVPTLLVLARGGASVISTSAIVVVVVRGCVLYEGCERRGVQVERRMD